MPPDKPEKTGSNKTVQDKKDRVAEIVNTLEWLVTAFILAFVFRAFVMEAFRIPTGSMADTLRGAHFRLRCNQCGYKYEHGFVPRSYGYPEDTIPAGSVRLPPTRCPNCGYFWPQGYAPNSAQTPVANGDRILVLKCIYQFFQPKRWDVVVFKNPLDPTVNYIKRLVGLPGETLEVSDGDIYINGEIARKPPKVQNELWMPVYNNDYQPVQPRQGSFNGHTWQQPFRNEPGSKWITDDPNNPTVFRLKNAPDQINTLFYDTTIGNDFRTAYAYDEVSRYNYMPYSSDLMVRFYAQAGPVAPRPEILNSKFEILNSIGISLSKYETTYKAWVDLVGKMAIAKISQGKEAILTSKSIEPSVINKPTLVEFANVDHQLIFQVGGEKLTYELGRAPNDAGNIREDIAPQVKIFASAQPARPAGGAEVTLSHVAVFRDIHYTKTDAPNRASQGDPIALEKDQFFVLGDNSPNSEDARLWNKKGVGINGQRVYRQGIVPRDYLVGRALFVYWPSGFRPFARFPFAVIPNVGQMRFVYGGSSKP